MTSPAGTSQDQAALSVQPTPATQDAGGNPLGIRNIDHIEFWVDDAEHWAASYEKCYGMLRRAYGDTKSGVDGKRSFVVGQGRINFVFSEPEGDSAQAGVLSDHLEKHGCAVRDVAFRVNDPAAALKQAVGSGAPEHDGYTENAGYCHSAIKTYGDTVHSFLTRTDACVGTFAPGYDNLPGGIEDGDINFMMIDHIVGNVEVMDEWANFYERVFGFQEIGYFDINSGKSALMSKVLGGTDGYIKMPINEPTGDNSQIQIFLDDNNGPGVQHIALLTSDIIRATAAMRKQGVEFLEVPDTYYDAVPERVPLLKEDLRTLQDLRILVDQDRPDGYLLQLFTQPVFDRPTLFHEIIQRRGNSEGFGEGNFQALFEAIEREQAKRGLL
ncbi:MAG: 4-hydroxyphenylpyruvate dioxygenase [Planctomycetota bacterium]